MLIRLRNASLVLASAIISSAATTTQPASTQPALPQHWTVSVPGQNLAVTISYPEEWLQGHHESGRPFVCEPAHGENIQPFWEMKVRTGLDGRTLEQILDQLSASAARRGVMHVLDKGIVDLEPDYKAAFLKTLLNQNGHEMIDYQFFYPIDESRIFVAAGFCTKEDWDKKGPVLMAICRAAKVTSTLKP